MILKTVVINDSHDEALRILDAIIDERRAPVEVSPSKLAHSLGISEGKVRYNVRQFVKLGYLRPVGKLYAPTDKVRLVKVEGL